VVYFQFVFAAITPILMHRIGSGAINFRAWIPFVIPLVEHSSTPSTPS